MMRQDQTNSNRPDSSSSSSRRRRRIAVQSDVITQRARTSPTTNSHQARRSPAYLETSQVPHTVQAQACRAAAAAAAA